MKLHILFGQRKCSYDGEYAPEALDVADEYAMEDNPEWLPGKRVEYDKQGDFESVAVLIVKVPNGAIDGALSPKVHEANAEVVP